MLCRPSLSQFHSTGFRGMVSEFLDDYALHSIIGDLTTQLSSDPIGLQSSTRHVQRFIHPSTPSVILDLSIVPLSHVPDMWLFIARRKHSIHDSSYILT